MSITRSRLITRAATVGATAVVALSVLVATTAAPAEANSAKPRNSKAVCSDARSLLVRASAAGGFSDADGRLVTPLGAQLRRAHIKGANTRSLAQNLASAAGFTAQVAALNAIVDSCVQARLVAPTTTTTSSTTTSSTTSTTTTTTPTCPIAPSGNPYRPGEFCPHALFGDTCIADGRRITCTDNNGIRWEPA